MYRALDYEDFIAQVRATDERVKRIKIVSVEVKRSSKEITFNFICDNAVDGNLRDKICEQVKKIAGSGFNEVNVLIKKKANDVQLISNDILQFLSDKFPSFSASMKSTDVICTDMGEVVKFVLRLTESTADYVLKGGILTKIKEHLEKKFCAVFAGGIDVKEKTESVSLLNEEVFAEEIQKIEHRTIKVKEVVVVDDEGIGNIAEYIEDAVSGDVTVCGEITEINERETKNGKPYFIISLDDTTGRTSGVYFSKKNTVAKIRDLRVGDCIITRGTIGDYNGRRSFTMNKINRCVFPSDFVKKEKFKKPVPKNYSLITPEPASVVKVRSVFDEEIILPTQLTGKTYVVFDLETTGIDLMSNGITEIGAVKIVNGQVKEQFHTLVKPDYVITKEIVDITGITEEMVKDAPKISSVIPDFIKFVDGCTVVAHNAEFDVKFIKRFAGAEDYNFSNAVLDTLEMARNLLPQLRKHDLHTLGEHFNVQFRHHRALSDAYATAEIFIELMKIKYN